MDNWTLKADLAAKIEEIKRCMPATYASIKDKATVIGNEAFTWVRRGLRGEPNCFYALEAGRVAGTPFTRGDVMSEIARCKALYGDWSAVYWFSEGCFDAPVASSDQTTKASNGTH